MTSWRDTPDDIFLQAHINHVIRAWGSCPDIPPDKVSLVIERAKKHYETFPDQIEVLEQEITKLIKANHISLES
jgi:hypothetical protein